MNRLELSFFLGTLLHNLWNSAHTFLQLKQMMYFFMSQIFGPSSSRSADIFAKTDSVVWLVFCWLDCQINPYVVTHLARDTIRGYYITSYLYRFPVIYFTQVYATTQNIAQLGHYPFYWMVVKHSVHLSFLPWLSTYLTKIRLYMD